MPFLRRPLLAAAFLGAALVAVAAVGLAGPLDPLPDDVGANTSAETGTAADDAVAGDNEVTASTDDAGETRWRGEPGSVDREDGSATVGGEAGTPGTTVDAPDAADPVFHESSEVSVTLAFSSSNGVGQLLSESPDGSPVYWDTSVAPELSAGLFAEDKDYDPRAGTSARLTAAPSLRPYYLSSVQPADGATVPPDDPRYPAPASSGEADADDGDRGGEAEAESTNVGAGLSDVVGIDNRTKAVAAVAATALPVFAWVLYHRIKGHAVLDNDTRKAIYDEVCREPGLGIKKLADAADVSYSTASYHLDRLEDAGMVVSSKRGKKICYFQNGGTYSEEERELLKVLRNEEAMRVFLDIHEHPGTYRTRIAERLDVSTTTVNWHLEGLVEAGLVQEDREGRTAHLYVAQEDLDARVRPLLDKAADDDEVDTPSPMVQLRTRLEAAPA